MLGQMTLHFKQIVVFKLASVLDCSFNQLAAVAHLLKKMRSRDRSRVLLIERRTSLLSPHR